MVSAEMTGASASSGKGSGGSCKWSFSALRAVAVAIGRPPSELLRRRLQPNRVLDFAHAAHLLRSRLGARRGVAVVDEARELYRAAVGIDVDGGGGARADVGRDRALH